MAFLVADLSVLNLSLRQIIGDSQSNSCDIIQIVVSLFDSQTQLWGKSKLTTL